MSGFISLYLPEWIIVSAKNWSNFRLNERAHVIVDSTNEQVQWLMNNIRNWETWTFSFRSDDGLLVAKIEDIELEVQREF